MSNYKIVINQTENHISKKDIANLDVIQVDHESLHVLDENHGMMVSVLNIDDGGKSQVLSVNGEKYNIRIFDMQDQLIQKLGFNKKKDQVLSLIKAPMPGLVLEIMVDLDQPVQKGDPLLVLEAMKMENLIKAPSSGTVKRIHIKKDSPINKGQLMLEIS